MAYSPRVLVGPDEVRAAVGESFGTSRWCTLQQDDVQCFADLTGDQEWIHVDAERAGSGPFSGTVAHGLFVLALAPRLSVDCYDFQGFDIRLAYGLDRVRFTSPFPVGARVRAHFALAEAQDRSGGLVARVRLSFEIEGSSKPGCVADLLIYLGMEALD